MTGTYFARMTRMELWPDFIMYRLVGLPIKKIHQRLNISQHACIVRERRLNQMMQDLFPKLYQWWKPHHDYTDHTLTAEITQEQKVIVNWVKERINQQTATCSQCGHFIKQRINLRNKKKVYIKIDLILNVVNVLINLVYLKKLHLIDYATRIFGYLLLKNFVKAKIMKRF